MRAKLAHWADVSDVALLKRLRNSENWLRSLCVELLRESGVNWGEEPACPRIRIVDGTIVKEPGSTGSQWRILYSLQLPNLRCDYFEVTATVGEGSGESLNRRNVHPQEIILADAGYCSIAGIEHVQRRGADVVVRVNPQSFVPYSPSGRRISLLPRLRSLSKEGQYGEWRVVLHGQDSSFAGRLCAVRKSARSIQQAHRRLLRRASKKQMSTRPGTFEFAKYVLVFTTRFMTDHLASPWREFSFALHQIQQAIEPHLPLRQTLFSWNQIAQALAENSRDRSLQLAKWRIW